MVVILKVPVDDWILGTAGAGCECRGVGIAENAEIGVEREDLGPGSGSKPGTRLPLVAV
jgi:hypothetical protein